MMELMNETPKQHKETLQTEVLDVWNKAVAYFNSISHMVEDLSANPKANFYSLAQRSALSVPDSIARSMICVTEKEKKESLEQAIESVASTVSALQLANQCGNLRKDLFYEAYREGKLIVRRLQNFARLSNLN